MKMINIVSSFRLAVILSFIVLASAGSALGNEYGEGPALPAGCAAVEAPEGHELVFRAYAIGVQIYRWSGTRWDLTAPAASLFADSAFENRIGYHFGGPTWMSNDGSSVVAARVDGCTPDATAVPWLLLRRTATNGDGLFGETSYIQRVNTTGGLAPTTAGFAAGVIARVPYTAEYYFYESGSIGR